jgi:pimeloyl-ACP methyl ester carboxylesterase
MTRRGIAAGPREREDAALTTHQELTMQRRDFIGLTLATMSIAAARHAAGLPQAPGQSGPSASLSAAEFHATRRFAATPFGRIAYTERGRGEAALFLHGFPLNSFQWRGVLGPLSTLRRCIAADFLGLGYSEPAAGQDLGPDSQVAMLIALLDKLAVGTVDLVANDSGGAVAQLLMTRHPERVRTLMLTNCDSEIDCPPEALMPVIAMARAGTFADTWLAAWVADKELARSPQGLGGQCYQDPRQPSDEAIDTYLRPLVATPQRKQLVHAYAMALERNVLAGIEAGLKASAIPTRILWGSSDTIFSPAGANYLDRTLGRSQGVRRLAGSKLFWPEERPDVIIAEARALWTGARPPYNT